MWSEGTIGVNALDDDKQTITCHYRMKHFEEGSPFGINGGRISKLTIRIDGRITCNYDRGWDIKPEDEATKQAFAILMHKYN